MLSVIIPVTRHSTIRSVLRYVRDAADGAELEIIIKLAKDCAELKSTIQERIAEFPELDIALLEFNGRTTAHQNRVDGFNASRGSHIHLLDDDDYVCLSFYKESLRVLSEGADIALTKSNLIIGTRTQYRRSYLSPEAVNPSSMLLTRNAATKLFEYLPADLTCNAEDMLYLMTGNRCLGFKYKFTNSSVVRGWYRTTDKRGISVVLGKDTYSFWDKVLKSKPVEDDDVIINHYLSLLHDQFWKWLYIYMQAEDF